MKKRRILALVHKGARPPDSLEGLEPEQVAKCKMEFDVLAGLRDLGHETQFLECEHDLLPIRQQVEEWKPHIVFNMLEDFHGFVAFDQHVVAYLELLRAPYTGCNPRGLVLSRDKALTKKILSYHRIQSPDFVVIPRGHRARTRKLRFPLIVKSVTADASAGISQASLVQNEEQLHKRVDFVHEQIGDALAEEYIEGRELYIGVLGNHRLQTFPIWELLLDKLPEGTPRIATEHIKWNRKYQEKYDIHSQAAGDLPPDLLRRLDRMVRRMYRILGLSGYARFDVRLREDGQVFVLEANANPDLSREEDFALSARAADLPYEQLLQRILNLGLRYHSTWHN